MNLIKTKMNPLYKIRTIVRELKKWVVKWYSITMHKCAKLSCPCIPKVIQLCQLPSEDTYIIKFASMNQIIWMKKNEVRKCIILLTIGFLITLQVLVVVFLCFSMVYCKICINLVFGTNVSELHKSRTLLLVLGSFIPDIWANKTWFLLWSYV